MLPKVVIHNSISLDGSITNFSPNMEMHYKIAGNYMPDARLIGSNTAKTGIKLYAGNVPEEKESDFVKQERDRNLPYWVFVDTKGTMKGLLHVSRRFEFCKDVIVLVSEETPKDYLEYLSVRNYDYHVAGKNHVDLKKSLELLAEKYKIRLVLTDTGNILNSLLINEGLVSEISLLVHPIVVGKPAYNVFANVKKEIRLKLLKEETSDGYVWVKFCIEK